MSDEIRGIAVLNDLAPEAVLFVVCVPDKGRHDWNNEPFVMRLPVRLAGRPPTDRNEWNLEIAGGVARGSPSVSCKTTRPRSDDPKANEEIEIFHNSGNWAIPVVLYSERYRGISQDSAWAICNDLNREILG